MNKHGAGSANPLFDSADFYRRVQYIPTNPW